MKREEKKGEKAKRIGKEEAWRGKGEREKAAGGGAERTDDEREPRQRRKRREARSAY